MWAVSLVVAVVMFDEVLQQVHSSLRLYLVDLYEILRERSLFKGHKVTDVS